MDASSDENDALSDRELPDESDMDPEGEDETETEPCPFCQREVFARNEFCPHCGRYISWEAEPSRKSIWIALTVAICLFLVIVYWIF